MATTTNHRMKVRLLLTIALFVAMDILMNLEEAMAQSCSTTTTFNSENKVFTKCNSLPEQGATLAWNLDTTNRTLEMLFSGTASSSSGWVGFGINPTSLAMAGTQAFIAFTATNGSNILTYDVTDATKSGTALKCTPISLEVLDQQVQISGTAMALLVKIKLSQNQSSTLNIVWNRGSSVSSYQPGAHGFTNADLTSMQAIDFSSGTASSGGASAGSHTVLKNRHAILNTVGWGIMLPCGVIAARYLKFADPAWFYIHVFLQLSGFAIGVAGWATGLKLGSYSVGIVFHKHRVIGIVLFAIATLQIMAILLRPKKDHKIRKAWNIYHYTLGVSILVLGILNIFYGFDILSPPARYRRAYIGVLIALAVIVVILEIVSWMYFCFRKKHEGEKLHGATYGGAHGLQNGRHV